ncbi:RNI-like protein [Testicularia cyperi]|uniref:RNI-like protein n=1 Tax=Testicularia cyperi TaxID=1882483 RepID=A0A317XTK4_9BASI|nr:RNI-like protein [Testicularia cyperi]
MAFGKSEPAPTSHDWRTVMSLPMSGRFVVEAQSTLRQARHSTVYYRTIRLCFVNCESWDKGKGKARDASPDRADNLMGDGDETYQNDHADRLSHTKVAMSDSDFEEQIHSSSYEATRFSGAQASQHQQQAKFGGDGSFTFPASSGSTIRSPMNIPQTAMTHNAREDTYFSYIPGSPSSDGGHANDSRRPSHRAMSSRGSSNVYDFFGPSSLASDCTAATSLHFASPQSSPKVNSKPRANSISQQLEIHSASDTSPPAADTAPEVAQMTFADTPPAEELPTTRNSAVDGAPVVPQECESAETRQIDSIDLPAPVPSADPPVYPEELLPSYEEAPAYTPPLSQPEASGSRSRTSAFRVAAANRFLNSRMAKKLNLPPTLRSRIQGTQTPTASVTSHEFSLYHANEPFGHARRPFNRSDSAPELPRQRHNGENRRVEMHTYAATAYMDGARMGPAPRNHQGAPSSRPSTRPSTPDTVHIRIRPSLRSRPGTSTGVPGAAPHDTSLHVRVTSTAPSSRRNSRDSRPSSRAAMASRPNGGLFTCGYSASRSGTATPSLSSQSKKSRSRNLSLRNLGDLFLHRDRDRNHDDDQDDGESSISMQRAGSSTNAASSSSSSPHRPDAGIASGHALRETVSPVADETLISARVTASAAAAIRPSLMYPAHTSPQAGITAASTSNSVLVSPLRAPRINYLEKLPRELILRCFKSLVDLHITEHDTLKRKGLWTGKRASETRWTGLEAAVRELARISRVSRAWQSYTLDGQLWQAINFAQFPDIAEKAMMRIARSAGPFVRQLDLHGMANLRSEVLVALFEAQWSQVHASGASLEATNQLQELDLHGCHSISTEALHAVLSNAPNLKRCNLSSLACVTNTTLCILAQVAPKLEVLNVSRCSNVSGEGLRSYFAIQEPACQTAAVCKERNMSSAFCELYASGITGMDAATMTQIGRQWPNLQVLDVSYCGDINNAAIAALTSSEDDVVSEKGNFVTLSPRQAGSHGDDEVTRRTFPELRKLKLSSCRALTDRACIELAYALPNLEVLELANIGGGIKDDGLIKLLATVPRLRRLDLERATHITDAVLSALTPPESHAEAYGRAVPEEAVLMSSHRAGASILSRSSRSASRRRQATSMGSDIRRRSLAEAEAPPPGYDEEAVSALIPATGTELTHLILSSANHLSAEAMLLLINRCPFLYHLELDDTHAGNAVATQFVQLARYRKVQNAYLSLADCRTYTRETHSQLLHIEGSEGGTRPRCGQRGYAFRAFGYDDTEVPLSVPVERPIASLSGPSSSAGHQAVTRVSATLGSAPEEANTASTATNRPVCATAYIDKGNDECNPAKVVLKSFWAWQLVDARAKQKRKMEQRAARRTPKSRVGSVVAMALGFPGGLEFGGGSNGGGGSVHATSSHSAGGAEVSVADMNLGSLRASMRWPRIVAPSSNRADYDDTDDEDARGCTVM